MKMSYRHRSPILLMAKTVSVFICICLSLIFCLSLSSCGIPTYWQPKNSTVIVKNSSSADTEIDFTTKVEFYSGDDGSNAPELGLALLYVYSETQHSSSFDTELVKTFNSDYRGSVPNGLSSLSCENNKAVWSFTVSDISYDVYAFTSISGSAISAPNYNKSLTSNTDFSKAISLKLNSDIDRVELYTDGVLDGTLSFGLEDLSPLQESSYVHVYAALSGQGANYSNIYWSNLTYVGSFSNFNTEVTETTSTND